MPNVQDIQDAAHSAGFKYLHPHLKHPELVGLLSSLIRDVVRRTKDEGLPLTALEIGAGHGGYTTHLLAAGCRVTATEMSQESIAILEREFDTNPNLRVVFEPDGSLQPLGTEQFSMALCSAVLHHIPDYLAFVNGPLLAHVAPGGSVLAFQDPLWYPRLSRWHHWADRGAYMLWRLPRGNYRRGLSALARRLTGRLDESSPSDMYEYHVLRQGVDEVGIEAALRERFREVEIVTYWSTGSRALQWAGDKAGIRNTFAIRATGYLGPVDAAANPSH